ncbi:CobW family GTP-binding protein [Endozoicomonas arenosclerae]|uniref:CobW family GTP-binding protein n=1 Tax=Endozoicomonas arenosclerae TaxID=1633495 RepID=UPI00078065DE|nr:GTP-binding protein [Endozoicomonas arenosclerae]
MSKSIPTNLITGFLGSGKTTAILHLLANKPKNETWGVLVNEFGEIGIDGAMMAGKGAVVREVPGGCMCCVAGLPMQIGLNMLIARSKPDRILIEPTGLGHPEQILQTLSGEHYSEVLDLKASICLLDPRNLKDSRYLENENFQDQIALADVVVANKTDCCDESDRERFDDFCRTMQNKKFMTAWVEQGSLEYQWLDLPKGHQVALHPDAHHNHSSMPETVPLQLPEGELFIRRENKGQGHFSCGWLYNSKLTFSFDALFHLFNSIPAKRLKAVIHTNQGSRAFNAQDGVVSIMELDECDNSRIEVIHDEPLPWDDIEEHLCRSAGLVPASE